MGLALALSCSLLWLTSSLEGKPNGKGPFNVTVPKVSTDPTIKYDYDIVYVRTPRKGNAPHSSRWPDARTPAPRRHGGHPGRRRQGLGDGPLRFLRR
jgi:hypothetical protein